MKTNFDCKLCSAIQKKIKDRINVVVVTKGKFLHKQRMRFRRKWAEYDSTSSSSSEEEPEDEDDQETEEKNAGEEEECEDPELVGKQLVEEMNEIGEEGNEEDDEEEPSEKKPGELYDPEVEDEKVERAWYHWSQERGPTANQDYQREIEDRGINLLLETLKGPGAPGDIVSYQHGGEYGRLEQVLLYNTVLLCYETED